MMACHESDHATPPAPEPRGDPRRRLRGRTPRHRAERPAARDAGLRGGRPAPGPGCRCAPPAPGRRARSDRRLPAPDADCHPHVPGEPDAVELTRQMRSKDDPDGYPEHEDNDPERAARWRERYRAERERED